MDYGCHQSKEEWISYCEQSGQELPFWIKPPTENISFYEAMKFIKDGWKVKRKKWNCYDDNYLFLNKNNKIIWAKETFSIEYTFEYEDICSNDWIAEKIKE